MIGRNPAFGGVSVRPAAVGKPYTAAMGSRVRLGAAARIFDAIAAGNAFPGTGAPGDLSQAISLLTTDQVSFGLGNGLVARTSPDTALALVGRGSSYSTAARSL